MGGPAFQVDLFAVQPRVSLEDYASPETFAARHRALAARVDALRERDAAGRPVRPALAVWPEMVGAPLGVAGHLERVRGCATTEEAMAVVSRAEWRRVLRGLRVRPRSRAEALHVAVARAVHRTMWSTFRGIARDFGLWLVAGSALLPESRRGPDTPDFAPVSARTYNTSATFSPEGACLALTRKVNLVPTQEDVLGLTAGRAEVLPVVDTPFGRLGTLIGYDGFCKPYTQDESDFTPAALLLDGLAVDIIAQPAANPWPWDEPWAFNAPGETQRRSEQWFDEGLFTQLRELTHARYVVNPQLVGGYFENAFEAPSLILERRGPGDVVVLARAADPRAECVVHVTVDAPARSGAMPRAASGG